MDMDATAAERQAEYVRVVAATTGAYQKTVEEAFRPRTTPEDIALLKLQDCTAYQAVVDFARALALPHNLLRWVRNMSKRRPDGKFGDDGVASAQAFVDNLFRVFLLEDLDMCIKSSTVDKSCTIYPFGLVHPHVSIPLELFAHDGGILACVNRMILVEQADVTSEFYSAKGGAFGIHREVQASGQVLFTKCNYNNVLSVHFPRVQFLACFMCELASAVYCVDLANDVDVDKALEMVHNGGTLELEHMPAIDEMIEHVHSETAAARLLCFVTLRDMYSEFSACLRKAEQKRSAVLADGRVQDNKPVREQRNLRRMEFALPHMKLLLEACDDFHLKALLAAWFVCQVRIARK